MKLFATGARSELVDAFHTAHPKVLEIGLGNSDFSRIILDSDPTLRLTGIDPFFENDGVIRGFYDHHKHRTSAEAIQKQYPERYELIVNTSPAGLADIPDGAFDWVFVDGDHSYNGVLRDLEAASRLVKPAGIVACHDFAVHEQAVANKQEVVEAVLDNLEQDRSLSLYGVDLSVYPTCILIKEPTNETADSLDRLLKKRQIAEFAGTATAKSLVFSQHLRHAQGVYEVTHGIALDGIGVQVVTESTRVFSGYYLTSSVNVSGR